MSSPRVAAPPAAGSKTAAIRPLLDAAFGFLVWAIHFLLVYTTSATVCQIGLRYAGPGAGSSLVIVLVLVTVVAAAAVVLHGVRRYRQFHGEQNKQFRLVLTIGCDSLAAVAIAWQLFAFLLVPPCR